MSKKAPSVWTAKHVSQSLTALQLRAAGYTYQEIADKAGYSTAATARVAVTRALERTFREPTKDLREIEARRLDALQAAVQRLEEELGQVRAANEATPVRPQRRLFRR